MDELTPEERAELAQLEALEALEAQRLSAQERAELAQLEALEALEAQSPFGDTGMGESLQSQMARQEISWTPEQRALAYAAQGERTRAVADLLIPGLEDAKTGGALAIGNVAANAFPVTRIARPFVQAGLALGEIGRAHV
jgi:hypothetical protein